MHGVIGAGGVLIALAIGDFGKANEYMEYARKGMRRAGCVIGLNYIYIHAANIVFYKGELQLAMANLEEAFTIAEDNFGEESGLMFVSRIFNEYLRYWLGEDMDVDQLESFEAVMQKNISVDMWFEIYTAGVEISVEYLLSIGDFDRTFDFISRCKQVAQIRSLSRLQSLVKGYELRVRNKDKGAENLLALAVELEKEFPQKCWQSEPSLWRPYFVVGQSLSDYWANLDLRKSIRIQQDIVDMCRYVEAIPYLVSALVELSLLLDKTEKKELSKRSISEALVLAVPHNIKQPFLKTTHVVSLLRNTLHDAEVGAFSVLTTRFIRNCSAQVKSKHITGKASSEQTLLTGRELEVLVELSEGLSNKEISRRLNMTSHTVKFHLRNIFEKLGVSRRGQAVDKARKKAILT